jgi:hypothetical protein
MKLLVDEIFLYKTVFEAINGLHGAFWGAAIFSSSENMEKLQFTGKIEIAALYRACRIHTVWPIPHSNIFC